MDFSIGNRFTYSTGVSTFHNSPRAGVLYKISRKNILTCSYSMIYQELENFDNMSHLGHEQANQVDFSYKYVNINSSMMLELNVYNKKICAFIQI